MGDDFFIFPAADVFGSDESGVGKGRVSAAVGADNGVVVDDEDVEVDLTEGDEGDFAEDGAADFGEGVRRCVGAEDGDCGLRLWGR